MKRNRTGTEQSGFGLPDAILAILITGLLITSSLLVIGKVPANLSRRWEEQQDLLRFIGLWRNSKKEMAKLSPYWWSNGLIVDTDEDRILMRESTNADSAFLEFQFKNTGELVLTTQDRTTTYQFIDTLSWSFIKDDSGSIIGMELLHSSGLPVAITAGARELHQVSMKQEAPDE